MNIWLGVSKGAAGETVKEQGSPEQRTVTEKVNLNEFEVVVGWD